MAYRKFFTMSLDDGLEQDKRFIELCKNYGLKCTFNLNGGLLGYKQRLGRIGDVGCLLFPEDAGFRRTIFKNHDCYRIPADEIKSVYEGFEIASHGYCHEALGKLPQQQMKNSIDRNLQALSELTGQSVCGHAYPFGSSSPAVCDYLKKKGVCYARAVWTTGTFALPEDLMQWKMTTSFLSKNIFALTEQFLQAEPLEQDLVFSVWGHGYEFDYGTKNGNWERLERFFETISGKQDIVYATNLETVLAIQQ